MVDMNRLVRKCLKAFFFSSFLNNFLFFSLSFYLIFAILDFVSVSLSFSWHCAHYVAKSRTQYKNRTCVCDLNAPDFEPNELKQNREKQQKFLFSAIFYIVAFVKCFMVRERALKILCLCCFCFCLISRSGIFIVAMCMRQICFNLAFILRNNLKFFPRSSLFTIVSVCLFIYAFRLFRCFQLDIENDIRSKKIPPYSINGMTISF